MKSCWVVGGDAFTSTHQCGCFQRFSSLPTGQISQALGPEKVWASLEMNTERNTCLAATHSWSCALTKGGPHLSGYFLAEKFQVKQMRSCFLFRAGFLQPESSPTRVSLPSLSSCSLTTWSLAVSRQNYLKGRNQHHLPSTEASTVN